MRILFVDTETTGLPTRNWLRILLHKKLYTRSGFPRLIQIGWQLTDENDKTLSEYAAVVRPDGFEIPERSVKVHGITTEAAKITGVPVQEVLDHFSIALSKSDLIVAHNLHFDKGVIQGEMDKAGMAGTVSPYLAKKHCFCTMEGTRSIFGKRPSLSLLYEMLFSETISGHHDALSDVKACRRCYFGLVHQGIIPSPTCNSNKSQITI